MDLTFQAKVWSRCVSHSGYILQAKHRGASFVILSSPTLTFSGYDLHFLGYVSLCAYPHGSSKVV